MQENVKVYLESRAALGDEVAAFILSTTKSAPSHEIVRELHVATEGLIRAIETNGKKWTVDVDVLIKNAINKINSVVLKLHE